MSKLNSRFVAVHGRRHAPIIARAGRGYVWARRVLPAGPGWHPAPACIFVPYASGSEACADASRVSSALGWRCSVQPESAGSSVFSQVAGYCPAFVLKVRLPAGVSGRAAFADVALVCGSVWAWSEVSGGGV